MPNAAVVTAVAEDPMAVAAVFTEAAEGSEVAHPADSMEQAAVLAAACGAMEAGARLVAEPIAVARATAGDVHLVAKPTGAAVTVEPIAAECTRAE